MRAVNERSRKSSPRLAAACTVSKILLRFTDDPRLLRGNKNWIKTAKEEEKKKEKESIFVFTISFPHLVSKFPATTFIYTDHFASLRIAVTSHASLHPYRRFIFENGGYETGTIRTPPNRGSDC